MPASTLPVTPCWPATTFASVTAITRICDAKASGPQTDEGWAQLLRITSQRQYGLWSDLAEKMRFKRSCAHALAASSRLLSEGKRSRNFRRIFLAHACSVERIVIPIRRNSRPCKNGRKSPATPRAINTHPVRMASQRLNFLVKSSTVHPVFLLVWTLNRKLRPRRIACVFVRAVPAFRRA